MTPSEATKILYKDRASIPELRGAIEVLKGMRCQLDHQIEHGKIIIERKMLEKNPFEKVVE